MAQTLTATYGTDSYCLDDLQYVSQQVTDPSLLIALRLVRRLGTPRGALGLIGGNPNGGIDVRQYVNAKRTPNFFSVCQADIRGECLKDQEVLACSVTVGPQGSDGIVITIRVQAADGPFTLVLNVDALTVSAAFSFQGQV